MKEYERPIRVNVRKHTKAYTKRTEYGHRLVDRRKRQEQKQIGRIELTKKDFCGMFLTASKGFLFGEMLWDDKGKPMDIQILSANRVFGLMLQKSVNELSGRTLGEFGLLENIDLDKCGRVALGGKPIVECRHYKALHKTYESYFFSPGRGLVCCLYDDLSREVFIENRMREQESLLKSVIDAIPDLIYYKDLEGRLVCCNKAFAESFAGKREEELFYQTNREYFRNPKELADVDLLEQDIIKNRKARSFDVKLKMADGHIGEFETIKAPNMDRWGNVRGVIGIAREITRRKAVEQELIEAKKAAEYASANKSQFLAKLSHEIRTPLSGIIGFINLLSEYPLTKEQQRIIGEVKNASSLLMHVVNEVLDLSKIEAGRLTLENHSFSLRENIQKSIVAITPLIYEKDLKIQSLIEEDVPDSVIGDSARLKQVLNNLLSNAVKFTEQGIVSIKVRNLNNPVENKMTVMFQIQDTGIGIQQENIKELFTPFTQATTSTSRKYGGSGLGLSIAKDLIKMMGGDIELTSEIGFGTTLRFHVVLGIANKNAPAIPMTYPIPDLEPDYGERMQSFAMGKVEVNGKRHLTKKAEPEGCTARIAKEEETLPEPEIGVGNPWVLLVEDNETNRNLMLLFLEKKNIRCEVATNGVEAYLLATSKDYDVILMDCQMPEMDGYECTRRIRKFEGNRRHTPIVAMTANVMAGDREKCIDAGMDDFIGKPVDFKLLMKRMKEIVEEKKTSKLDYQIFEKELHSFIIDTGIDEETAIDIFNVFVQKLPGIIQAIEIGMDTYDFNRIGKLAHQLKGTSGNLRLGRLHELCRVLGIYSAESDARQCRDTIETMKCLLTSSN